MSGLIKNMKIKKLNEYFYMTTEGQILKYQKYCIIDNCKKLSSFNYPGEKKILYCNEHKKNKMINIRKGYKYCDKHNISYLKFCKMCEIFDCLICNETVNKSHYFSKSHIDKVEKNISIKIRDSIKKKFIDIIVDFHIIDKDVFYKDLYFKNKIKDLILKHRNKDKNYKINLYKYNQSVKNDLTRFWVEKFNIDNMNEIDNIDQLNLKNFKNLKVFNFDNLYGINRNVFDGTPADDLENINIISEDIEYDISQIRIIQNTRLLVKLSECNLFSSGDSVEINKIPELFFNKKNLVIIRNVNNKKCLLYSYIRKFLNPIEKNASRINKKDIQISNEIIDQFNLDFENISLEEIDKIEDLLECNIFVFGCDNKLNSKKIIRKSLKTYDKILDLLVINDINHYILIKNLNLFIGNNSHIVETCRNCLNCFYSKSKYDVHLNYCKNRKCVKLMPSHKKYLKFDNLKNCIKSNFIVNSDFECIIDPISKEHTFVSGAYYLECKNDKYTKNIQCFYDLEEYCKSLYNELEYIENIEKTYLNNPIDYTHFNEEEYKNNKQCEYCLSKFDDKFNDRVIILNEIVDKTKLEYIINNNDFNQEVNNIAKNYLQTLDNLGRKKVSYKQKDKHKDRYYAIGSCLTYLKKEIRNSIMPLNIKDLDMVNCHCQILKFLCDKENVKCNILTNYIQNREIILESFGNDRKEIKKMFLSILNGGFKKLYSKDTTVNDYLKLFEEEIFRIQNYFYLKDKRYFKKDYNFMGKSLSRIVLDVENQILQTMIDYLVSKKVEILTLEYDGLKIYSNKKTKHWSINDLEKVIFKTIGINMKLAFKDIVDSFPSYGIRVSVDNIINENIIENRKQVIHHDHALEQKNILSTSVCNLCNLQIKNNYKIPLLFFNGSKYDFSIILNAMSKIYKDDISISCVGKSVEHFKSVEFKFKNLKYSYKMLDISNFIKGSLGDLSNELSDKHKIVTKKHFENNFEILKRKAYFPYEFINNENLYDKELPPLKDFYSSLKLQNIKEDQYNETLKIYKELKCKNIKDYLEIYMVLDVCLQADVFNVFRDIIWDKFSIDCSKYQTSCSLSLDLMLKYTRTEIELFKDVSMFDFADASVKGGLCIASENFAHDDDKSTISEMDVVSLYPSIMRKKLPVSDYKFISNLNFNENKYGEDKDYSCLMNVEIYTTKKVLDNKILSNFPALTSKTVISYDQLSNFQKKNLKENYKSSEKLINHLGYDKNSYISFEMFEMLKSLGYRVNVKEILEYKHTDFMKSYIDYCFEMKSHYKEIGDKNMSLTFKILMNSLFGILMTKVQNFKDFKIITSEKEVNKYTTKPNFITRNIIHPNLTILEMGKTSIIYSYPILTGSIILQNSKVHMYNYLYKIYPKLFGNDFKILYMDTDSIYSKLNMSHTQYLNIVKNNSDVFGKEIGQLSSDHLNNKIKECVFLSSKCYSYICENDIPKNINKLKNNIIHTKGISDAFSKQYIDHEHFKKILINNDKADKIIFNTIKIKNQIISTTEIKKNNIEFLNDKRFIEDINTNIPHTLYIN